MAPRLVVALALAGVAGCGSDGDRDGTIARIEIRPGALILTTDRTGAQLEAVAFDEDGNEVKASFTWGSSTPDQVAVDEKGNVTALEAIGSATVWAEAGEVRSPPSLIASVELHPGSQVVTDAQVVEIGTPFLPDDAAPDAMGQFDARLRDVDVPAPGTILVPAESATIAGVVVSAAEDGGEVDARVQLVPLPDLFARYDIDWELNLADYEIVVDEEQAAASQIAAVVPAEQKIETEWPPGRSPLRCTASAALYVKGTSVELKVKGEAKLKIESHRRDAALPPGYLKVAIEGPLKLVGFLGFRVETGFKTEGTCEIKTRIPIRLGPFALIASPAIPLGLGVQLKGEVKDTNLTLGLEGEIGYDLSLGFECPGGDAPCRSLDRAMAINSFKPKVEAPSSMESKRVELSAQVYFLSGIDILFGLGLWTFEAVKVTIGPIQSAKLATVNFQANDASYASEYDLKIEGKVVPGASADKAIKELIGVENSATRLGLEFKFVAAKLASSPTGTMTVDKTQAGTDSKVKFDIILDGATIRYWILGPNVESIEIYRKREDSPVLEHMGSVATTSSNQTLYKWEWTPGLADLGQNQFFAFVKTKMPVVELEIAADSSKYVEVVEMCSARTLADLANLGGGGGGSSCELTGTMSRVYTVSGPNTSVNNTVDATVTLQHDPEGSVPGLLVFRPYSANSSGCVVTVQPDPMTGTLSGDPTQGAFMVYTGDELHTADHYHGMVATGAFPVTTTLACPDAEPFVQDQFYDFPIWTVFEDQMLLLDPVTRRATGTYTTTSGGGGTTATETFSWDLTLSGEEPPPPP
jgi:hypothetical protein